MASPLDGGVVLVTGASSGIGRAFAELVSPRARAIVLVARRKERLEELRAALVEKNPKLVALVVACDLGDRTDVDRMLAEVEKELGPVDVLINNAGFGDVGIFDLADWDKTERMIQLNCVSLAYLTHRLVGGMVARGRGGILNVSSGWGLTFAPGLSAYIGTKHFVTSFTESLRLDLAGTGVVVTQVCPGPVATEFLEVAGNPTGQDIPGFVVIDAETCATKAIRGLDRGRALVIPGLLMRVVMFFAATTPRWVLRLVYRPIGRALRKKQVATKLEAKAT